MRTAQVTTEAEVQEAERIKRDAQRKMQEIEAQRPAARSPLELLQLQDAGVRAQAELKQAEERLRSLREEYLRPSVEARRERVRAAAAEALETGRVFQAANMALLQAQAALMELVGDMEPIWFPGAEVSSPAAESAFEHWAASLRKNRWLD